MQLFEAALAKNDVIVFDGGLATELEAQGHDIGTHLWSAGLLRTNPQAIVDAHRAFLDAGAQCIISASYQASRGGLMSLGLSASAADGLILSSITLAQTARRQFLDDPADTGGVPMVAASVGPYGAALQDGSEYTGNYEVSRGALRTFHEQRLELLDESGADVLACETIPDIDEAAVLCELLRETRTPAWISFSCRDGQHISDGTTLENAVALFRDHPRVMAVGVNCTAPQHITSLIRVARLGAPGKAVVVYPNSGETYNAADNSWSGTVSPIDCAVAAGKWRDAGAIAIGGCCRMGPRHISEMRRYLSAPIAPA